MVKLPLTSLTLLLFTTLSCAPAGASINLLNSYTLAKASGKIHEDKWQIEGDSHKHLFSPMAQYAEEIGVSVYYVIDLTSDNKKIFGAFRDDIDRIYIDKYRNANTQVATLAHELAHALTPGTLKRGHRGREIFAEAVALLVMKEFGLDISPQTYAYFKFMEVVEFADPNVLQYYSNAVQEVAAAIIAGIRRHQ